MLAIPVAQYPDIVPPQVSVTTSYPGASAEVVDSTVAQPIESQVVGVDKLIYMKSVSGNDGSYTLTGSFELGTDPTSTPSTSTTASRSRCPSCRRTSSGRA